MLYGAAPLQESEIFLCLLVLSDMFVWHVALICLQVALVLLHAVLGEIRTVVEFYGRVALLSHCS